LPGFRLIKPLNAALCAAVALLAGCAALPEILPGAPAHDFELEGRAAVRYGGDGGSTRISWRHGRSADDLLITGPIGQGIARVTRRGDEVLLATSDGREFRAGDAESLTESVLGWRLPLSGLSDWVRGQPSQGRPARIERDGQGRITEILQDEWTVEYLAWEGALPSRMALAREGARGKVELRLVIDQWKQTPR
jgi:outer membrane lipoprotein LolB